MNLNSLLSFFTTKNLEYSFPETKIAQVGILAISCQIALDYIKGEEHSSMHTAMFALTTGASILSETCVLLSNRKIKQYITTSSDQVKNFSDVMIPLFPEKDQKAFFKFLEIHLPKYEKHLKIKSVGQYALAQMHLKGCGTDINNEKAFSLFSDLANQPVINQQVIDAEFQISIMLYQGTGTIQNKEAAFNKLIDIVAKHGMETCIDKMLAQGGEALLLEFLETQLMEDEETRKNSELTVSLFKNLLIKYTNSKDDKKIKGLRTITRSAILYSINDEEKAYYICDNVLLSCFLEFEEQGHIITNKARISIANNYYEWSKPNYALALKWYEKYLEGFPKPLVIATLDADEIDCVKFARTRLVKIYARYLPNMKLILPAEIQKRVENENGFKMLTNLSESERYLQMIIDDFQLPKDDYISLKRELMRRES